MENGAHRLDHQMPKLQGFKDSLQRDQEQKVALPWAPSISGWPKGHKEGFPSSIQETVSFWWMEELSLLESWVWRWPLRSLCPSAPPAPLGRAQQDVHCRQKRWHCPEGIVHDLPPDDGLWDTRAQPKTTQGRRRGGCTCSGWSNEWWFHENSLRNLRP